MNINVILANIKTAIRTNSKLTGWCMENYGKTHKIFIGIDPENLPSADDYPLIVLRQSGKLGGLDIDNEKIEISMICGLYDDARNEDNNGDVTYWGEYNQEMMRKLAMNALATADFDHGELFNWNSDVDPENQHPVYLIATNITIKRPYFFGEGVTF